MPSCVRVPVRACVRAGVSGVGFQDSGFRIRVSGRRFAVLESGVRSSRCECCGRSMQFQVLGFCLRISDFGLRGWGFGVRGFKFEDRGLGFGVWGLGLEDLLDDVVGAV